MAVYFHGNFGLNRERMAGLLKYALENPELKDKELAEPFGYGAPYAQRYRQWLDRTGITSLRLPLKLTPMGSVVYKNDPSLKTMTSQWFMHWELVTDAMRAEAWHFFYYDFLPKREGFLREDLQMALMKKLSQHSEEHFGSNSSMLTGIVSKIIQCYTEDLALGKLRILGKAGGTYLNSADNNPSGIWNEVEELQLAYEEHY